MEHTPVYYGEYLQLDKIIDAQSPESFKKGRKPAHDEMLFIVIHQAYELWFKQILFEVNSALDIMSKPSMDDNSGDLQTVVHRLKRSVTILKLLVQQIDVIETMTPMDFLDFRDMLRPASGFQSWQFKILEAKLGLKYENRHGQEYYISQLKQKEIDIIKAAEDGKTLIELLNNWLERMPFGEDAAYWPEENKESFWQKYENIYKGGLAPGEVNNKKFFDSVFANESANEHRALSPKACRSALFILLYRGYPMLELPYQLIETLIEIDNQLGNWRSRHINMVRRMIGSRIGTGGSSGAGYLQGAMDKHYIFKELTQLNSFLIDRNELPKLPESVTKKLGYNF